MDLPKMPTAGLNDLRTERQRSSFLGVALQGFLSPLSSLSAGPSCHLVTRCLVYCPVYPAVLLILYGPLSPQVMCREPDTQDSQDTHSPPILRVLGPLSNTPAFARHFHCPHGALMNPFSRCQLW